MVSGLAGAENMNSKRFWRHDTEERRTSFLQVRDISASERPQTDPGIPLTPRGDAAWESQTEWLRYRFPNPPGLFLRRSFKLALEVRQIQASQADIDANLFALPADYHMHRLGTNDIDILAAIYGPRADYKYRDRIRSELIEENQKRLAGQPNRHEWYLRSAKQLWAGYAHKNPA